MSNTRTTRRSSSRNTTNSNSQQHDANPPSEINDLSRSPPNEINDPNSNHNVGVLESIKQTVGIIALAVTTLFLEFYLRLLDHFHPGRNTPYDDVDGNANYHNLPRTPVTWKTRLKSIVSTDNALHILRFCQRLITFRALLTIAYELWPDKKSNRVLLFCTLLIVPRLLFSLFIIMKRRRLDQANRPTNPNRHVNMTLMLLHYTYKGIRHIFKVLNGIEQIVIYICQTIEFIFIQLLGYTYRNRFISFCLELESIIILSILWYLNVSHFKCFSTFLMSFNDKCMLPMEIVLMLSLYFIKFSLKLLS